MPRPRSWLRLALVAAALLAAPPSPEAFSHGGGETHARTFPSLLSDSPMRVDVHLNVTTPGVVTVALWPSGWQHPSLAFADTSGELDAASIALVRSARDALVATLPSAPSGGSHPPAALAADPAFPASSSAVPASACCSPNLTWHLRRPLDAASPPALYVARNGTHEWVPGSKPPALPKAELAFELGDEGDASSLASGLDASRAEALLGATARAAATRRERVSLVDEGAAGRRTEHFWSARVTVSGYAASQLDDAGVSQEANKREYVERAFAEAAGLSFSQVAFESVADDTGSASDLVVRVHLRVGPVVDPASVASARAGAGGAAFDASFLAALQQLGAGDATAASSANVGGVSATALVAVAAETAEAWAELASQGGVSASDVEAELALGWPAESRTAVASVATAFSPLGDGAPAPLPGVARFDVAGDFAGPRTAYDVVYAPFESSDARGMTVVVARFDADAIPSDGGGHEARVSFHEQPWDLATARALILDADGDESAGGAWQGAAEVADPTPPAPPPPPSPPPRVESLETNITLGPAPDSVHALGTVFAFHFRPSPSCAACGMPPSTRVRARFAREPDLDWGEWVNAFAIDVTLPDGSVEKRFKYEHYPKSNGVYRVEAQAFDALDDAAPGDAPYLVDPTPATRRYVVGAVVASEGALDRKTGVLTFDFDRDVPFGLRAIADAGSSGSPVLERPETVFSADALAVLGPLRELRWLSPRRLRATLPDARESGLCAAWRARRDATPGSPDDLALAWNDPDAWFEYGSGFAMEPSVSVRVGGAPGSTGSTGSTGSGSSSSDATATVAGPRRVGECQPLALDAARADGGWDAIVTWALVDPIPPADPDEDADPAGLAALAALVRAASDANDRRLEIPASATSAGTSYAFAATIATCDGSSSTAERRVERVAGKVPGIFPTAGGDAAYETRQAEALVVGMEVRLPSAADAPPGSACAADSSALTYAWANLTGAAPCLFSDERSDAYDGFVLAPRATRRSLTIPPFCLRARAEPYRFRVVARFAGAGGGESSTDVEVTVTRTPPVAVIRGGGGPRRIQKGAAFVLDASDSRDPDGSEANAFAWACARADDPGAACGDEVLAALAEASEGPLGRAKTSDLGASLRIGERYAFTVTFTNAAGRAANFTTTVEPVRDAIPTVTLEDLDAAAVSSTARVRLRGAAERVAGTGALAFSWRSDPPLDFTRRRDFATPTDASSLVIRPGVLIPGETYVFTLAVKQDGVATEGWASAAPFRVVGPPVPGVVLVSPASGDALRTEFTISTSGWGGGGALSYSLGYVALGARGEETEVTLSEGSAATSVRAVLPANVTADGGVGRVRAFAYGRVEDPSGATAKARAEGTVAVAVPEDARGNEAREAARAVDRAEALGDAAMRAAAAVAAAASLNAAGGADHASDASSDSSSERDARRAVRARAMRLVAAAAAEALEDVAADPGMALDPDVVRGLALAVATVAASPEELEKETATVGVETLARLLRAASEEPTSAEVLNAAAASFDGALEVVVAEIREEEETNDRDADPARDPNRIVVENDVETADDATRGRRRRARRLLQADDGNEGDDGDAGLEESAEKDGDDGDASEDKSGANANDRASANAPPESDALVTLALDASTAAAAAAVRGRAPNETATSFSERHVSIYASRRFAADVGAAGVAFASPAPGAASYTFPPSLASSLDAHAHVDLFLYRVAGGVLPSATRMMTDGSAVDVRGEDGRRPSVDPNEEVFARVPFTGEGLRSLEKVIYEYRCARHSGGTWTVDEDVVRTVEVIDTAPGQGHVTCAGRGLALLGYLVGIIISPIDFTVEDADRVVEGTMNAYWYIMGGTAAAALAWGYVALKRGMRRYTVKIANNDAYAIEN